MKLLSRRKRHQVATFLGVDQQDALARRERFSGRHD
jgi:hypothetical protein